MTESRWPATPGGSGPEVLAAGPDRRGRTVRPRRSLRTLLVVLVTVVVLWAVGSWHFAGQIHADALSTERAPEPVPAVGVQAVAADSITLRLSAHAPAALSAPGLWGLRWEGGYGQVGGILDMADGQVRRRFTTLIGDAPDLGQRVELDRAAFGDNPRDVLGLPYRDVTYRSPLGRFPAWLVPSRVSNANADDTWAVMVHGRQAERSEQLRALRTVHLLGLAALVPAYRNDPGAEADPSGLHQFGRTEWRDLEGAVRYALEQGASDVVLFGSSMGGAVTASFLAHSALADNVTRVVLDGPLLDLAAAIDDAAGRERLPGTSVPLPPGLAQTASLVAELRYGVDLDDFDQTDELVRARVPVLVFHGTADERAPVEVSDAVVRARRDGAATTRYVRVRRAEHVSEWNTDPGRYDAELRSFLLPVAG